MKATSPVLTEEWDDLIAGTNSIAISAVLRAIKPSFSSRPSPKNLGPNFSTSDLRKTLLYMRGGRDDIGSERLKKDSLIKAVLIPLPHLQ